MASGPAGQAAGSAHGAAEAIFLAPASRATAAPPSDAPPRGTGSRDRCACAANVEPNASAGMVRGEAQTSGRNARCYSSHNAGGNAA